MKQFFPGKDASLPAIISFHDSLSLTVQDPGKNKHFSFRHSRFWELNRHEIRSGSGSPIPISEERNLTAERRARNVFRLQHRGPPCRAISRRARAVIRFESLHSSRESGVVPVITLIKIPVPTAAPQSPRKPQKPPLTISALLRAFFIPASFFPCSPR